ncbi:MAG TPA: hypothetical protein VNW90_31270 [Acetobacteraceae bacterium]|nr:hypothetical protein [Acetobacteraceae bacterium]
MQAIYWVACTPEQFPTLVPFLMLNRMGQTVLAGTAPANLDF